ncbi:hypothetical protein F4604DRAFT_1938908 [Suillus subluteus]|nr:hypothetical protein F4604DRAFT_1938908 [Suillus subluteus]
MTNSTSDEWPSYPMANSELSNSEFIAWLNTNHPTVNDSESSFPQSFPLQPPYSGPQEFSMPMGGSGPSTQDPELHDSENDSSNFHSFWQACGGDNHHFNFEAPFGLRLRPPPSFPNSSSDHQLNFEQAVLAVPAASRMPQTQISAGCNQVCEATSSSFPNPQNFSRVQDSWLAMSQTLDSTCTTRHIPLPTSFPECPDPVPLQEPPSLPHSPNLHGLHSRRIGYSLQEVPMSNVDVNLYTPSSLPPSSFPILQDVSAHQAHSDGLPASGSHQRDRISTTPLDRGQEDVKSKLVRPRRVNPKHRGRAKQELKFIEYRPSGLHNTVQSPVVPLQQSIFVEAEFVTQVKDTSYTLMVVSIFDRGFFPSEIDLTQMADRALDTAIDQFPDHGDLKKWKTLRDGTDQIDRLKGTVKTTLKHFQTYADIFVLAVYRLSLDPWQASKAEMDILRTAKIDSLLLGYEFVDAWVQFAHNGNLRPCRVPFGHISVISLIEYLLTTEKYSRYVSLSTPGWETRLWHIIAAVTTVYHSALLKFKVGPESREVDEQEKVYNAAIERLASVTGLERFMLNELLLGISRLLA